MKICVSSKTLEMQLRKAINDKAELVVIEYKNNYMHFGSKENVIPMETSKRETDDYYAKFHPDQWSNVLNFLTQIEEQPIVIEFTHYLHTTIHERPEILISQISKYFN